MSTKLQDAIWNANHRRDVLATRRELLEAAQVESAEADAAVVALMRAAGVARVHAYGKLYEVCATGLSILVCPDAYAVTVTEPEPVPAP